MELSAMPGPFAYDSDYTTDEFLEKYDVYIVALARKKVPRNVVHPEMLADEIDELAQRIRIKLWLMLQKRQITSPKAYINCIAHSESVDMVRQHKSTLPLPMDEDGEIYPGNLLITSGEGMQDPTDELEEEEAINELITNAAKDVRTLPPCQLRAFIYSLQDQIEDILPLVDALKDQELDIEKMSWQDGKEEVQRLRASLSIARKKLRMSRDKYIE